MSCCSSLSMVAALTVALMATSALLAEPLRAGETNSHSPYAQWTRGPSTAPDYFPIAVWLQSPNNAERYAKAGFNTFVGLWKGPTEEQLTALKKNGLRVICSQNELALRHLDDETIMGWMHGDEPDNAQELPNGKGYGPPITPEVIQSSYARLQQADPSRPVLLNLGQGVAWDGWYGRGVRSRHPEDYPHYLKGCDIASFDIHPAVHDHADVAGKLWLVPYGVERLRQWSEGKKIVWNCLECTRISNPNRKPTPQEVRCEAWMSLIYGSQGLIYFVHQFKPVFREAAIFDDPEMLQAVTELNRQIKSLAPVLNTPTLTNTLQVKTDNPSVPLATMLKQHEGALYVLAVALREGKTKATLSLPKQPGERRVEVLGESRTIPVRDNSFSDEFGNWDVHIYRLKR